MLTRMNVKPMSLWHELHGDMENWLAANGQIESSRWTPAVDVIEAEDHYLIKADVPGVSSENIDIVFENGSLVIKGERKQDVQEEHQGYKRIERTHGAFVRTFRMPENIDADKITAKNESGVLEVYVAKQEKTQKKIIVQ